MCSDAAGSSSRGSGDLFRLSDRSRLPGSRILSILTIVDSNGLSVISTIINIPELHEQF